MNNYKLVSMQLRGNKKYVRPTVPEDCASMKLGVAQTQVCSYSYPTIYTLLFLLSTLLYIYIERESNHGEKNYIFR